MSQAPFPGYGQRGGKPRRPGSGMGNGTQATDGTGNTGRAAWDAEDDFDQDAALDRLLADVDAGRIQIPAEEPIAEGLTVSLAEVTSPDAACLAGLDVTGFTQGGAADTMAPGTALLALAETACTAATLPGLDDNQVLGLAAAGKRIAALATWIELSAATAAHPDSTPTTRTSTGTAGTATGPSVAAIGLPATGPTHPHPVTSSRPRSSSAA